MSNTADRLYKAAFPEHFADILIETLHIAWANLLSVKDALYHFRYLDDDQAGKVLQAIAARIEPGEEAKEIRNDPIRAAAFDNLLNRYGDDDPADRLVDLLTDARHWCDLHGQSFWEQGRRAHQHYLTEIQRTERSKP
jgi:hypothetical protein